MGTRQQFKSADEYDAVYARRIYCYLQRAGVSSKVKRRMRRRERHDAAIRIARGEEK